MTTLVGASEGDPGAPEGDSATVVAVREDRSRRAALIVFVAFVACAFPIVLFGIGSYHWFFRDDFTFLATRSAGSLDDLFRPHAGHWSTVPVLAFRALWAVVGLHSYVPYQACVLALHLTACVLLRVIMRSSGVGPWTATIAASTFVLYGPGGQDIVWAFQIGFTGSLAFGLAQLVLADHDGPVGRRDALAVAAGALALMSSGVGIAMALVAGIAILGRRGWRAAAVNTAPLALLYVVWWLVEQPEIGTPFGRPPLDVTFDWVRSAEEGVFRGIGHFTVGAALLGVVLVVGLVLAWARMPWTELRRRASIPAALLVGGIVFAVFTAEGRWFLGVSGARAGRYVHIGTALVLPALAVAVYALVQRWRVIGIGALALLLLGLAWNTTGFESSSVFDGAYMRSREETITQIVRLPEARQVPRSLQPTPEILAPEGLTIGFLLDAVDAGKLDPPTGPMSRDLRAQLVIRLGVAQTFGAAPIGCKTSAGPRDLTPARGTDLGFTTPLTVALGQDGTWSRPVTFNPGAGNTLTIELRGLRLRFAPVPGAAAFTWCPAGATR